MTKTTVAAGTPPFNFERKKIVTSLTIPEKSEIELVVRPCGDGAWVPMLLLWPQEMTLQSTYLELEFSDCLNMEALRFAIPAWMLDGGPEALVEDVRHALAAGLFASAKLYIDHGDDRRPEFSCVSLRLVAVGYESVATCPWQHFVKALNGAGFSKEEMAALELGEESIQ